MLTIGRDPQLTETDTHHHALKNLEVFPRNFALSSVFPFLKVHGVSVPVRSIREPFQIQAGWNTVSTVGDCRCPSDCGVVLSRSRRPGTQQEARRTCSMDSTVDGQG